VERLASASTDTAFRSTGESSMAEFFKYLTLREEQREEKRKAEEAAKEEKRRQDELAREERFQKIMVTMLQAQAEGYQNRVSELEEARRQKREEQQRLQHERDLKDEAREEHLKAEIKWHEDLKWKDRCKQIERELEKKS